MSEKSDKLRAMLAKEKERRIKLNNRIEILERRIQEEDSAEVNEMVRTAKVTPEQLAALLRQSATATPFIGKRYSVIMGNKTDTGNFVCNCSCSRIFRQRKFYHWISAVCGRDDCNQHDCV